MKPTSNVELQKPKSYLIEDSVVDPRKFSNWGEYMEANSKKTGPVKAEQKTPLTVKLLKSVLSKYPDDMKIIIKDDDIFKPAFLEYNFQPIEYAKELKWRQDCFKSDAQELGLEHPETKEWLEDIQKIKAIGSNALVV